MKPKQLFECHTSRNFVQRQRKVHCTLSTYMEIVMSYLNEIKHHCKESMYVWRIRRDCCIQPIPSKKCRRLLLLGKELDKQVQSYVPAMCDGKGAVTAKLMVFGSQAVRPLCGIMMKNLTMIMEDPLHSLDIELRRSILEWMNIVKSKHTAAAKIEPSHFWWTEGTVGIF